VTSWNALAMRAFAEAGAVLDRADYVDVARRCADFLLGALVRDGTALRTWKDGRAKITGFLEDVAYLADALLYVYEATGDPAYFTRARSLCEDMVARYHDPVAGFYDTALDGEPLLVRPRTLDDNPIPAGQSMAAHALLRLAAFTGEERYREVALDVVRPLAAQVAQSPLAFGNLGWALELAVAEPREVAIAGDRDAADTRALLRVAQERFDLVRVLAWGQPGGVPLLQDRPQRDGRATAYVCRAFACEEPVVEPEALRAQLQQAVVAR